VAEVRTGQIHHRLGSGIPLARQKVGCSERLYGGTWEDPDALAYFGEVMLDRLPDFLASEGIAVYSGTTWEISVLEPQPWSRDATDPDEWRILLIEARGFVEAAA
jgi:hypothetical protein